MSMPIRAAGAFAEFSRDEIAQAIPRRFERQVARHSGRRAVKTAGWDLTYRELNSLANQVAHSILALRDGPNQPVALLLEQDAPLIAAILGVLKSGSFYVPLDAAYPRPRLEEMVRHAGAKVVIADRANLDLGASLAAGGRSLLSMEAMSVESEEDPCQPIPPDAPAYIYYTSGSTGTPKGVVDNHRNVLHNIMRYTNGLRIGAADRLSLLQTPSFSGAVSSVFSALLNGAASYPFDARGKAPEELARWARENELTVWHSVPSLFRQLCLAGGQFDSFRVIRLEGDQALPSDVTLFKRHFPPECVLVNGMGATEAGIVRRFFIGHDTEIPGGVVPIGYPVEDMDVVVLDQNGSERPFGEVGEIAVRSKYLATGYWNEPERTERAFEHSDGDPELRLYRTGDLGRMRPDGLLEHLGRNDSQIKIQGHTIEAGAVEAALCELAEVRHAVVLAAHERLGEASLAAYLVLDGAVAPTVSAMRRRLAERLPAHMIPSHFVILDHLPLNGSGKVDRRRLLPAGRERPRLDAPYAPPVTSTEKRIAETWRQTLEIDDPGIDDDFFDLGGRSVDVARVLARLPVPLATFVAQPTIRRIAAEIDAAEMTRSKLLVSLRATGGKPVLLCAPGHDGALLGYANLERRLPEGWSVIALVPPALTELGVPFRLEDLAARYVSEIHAAEPEGPYLLSGLCFGGYVAYEIACQLSEQGADVALLALVECQRPTSMTLVEKLRYLGSRLVSNSRATARSGPAHLWKRARVAFGEARERRSRRAFERCVRDGRPLPDRLHRLDLANQAAAAEYVPRQFAGRTLLLGSAQPQAIPNTGPLMGWDGLLVGDVETHLISDHTAGLLSEPVVQQVACRLRSAFEASLRST